MAKKKEIPPYYVINWDFNHDELEFYNVMPYFVNCWDNEKKRKHKTWIDREGHKEVDDTKMPETFEEFKEFIDSNARYNYWARCEYEVIVTGWPVQKKEHKLDVYEQIKANLNIITALFMSYIKGGKIWEYLEQ